MHTDPIHPKDLMGVLKPHVNVEVRGEPRMRPLEEMQADMTAEQIADAARPRTEDEINAEAAAEEKEDQK
jgi:hypothetical protein